MKRFLLITVWVLLFQFGFSQIPAGYYDGADGLTGDPLKSALHDIIDGHNAGSYDLLWTILPESDEDPDNSSNFILIYTGRSIPKTSSYPAYNREHVWAKSHGDFDTDPPAGTDAHHLRPSDVDVNSARGNLDFDNGGTLVSGTTGCYSDDDSFEPRDAVKGDVARMMFYMATRYEGDVSGEPDLELVDYITGSTSSPIFGKLSTLLEWHNQDPVDDFERHRNEIVYSYQNNRNPFIDHPEYVASIWGGTGVYISDVQHTPTIPTSSDVVVVTATITSSGGTITSTNIKWGTSSGTYPNTVVMTSSKGTYSGNIPAGADGTTIYYIVEANDDNAESATSSEYNYIIDDTPSLTVFYEDFETVTEDEVVDINGWTRYEEAGTKTWEGREYESNKYAQMRAYSSGESSNISWLITPEIDLSSKSLATLSFKSKDGYNFGDPVELFISTDYSGTGAPSTASWIKLTATFATGAPTNDYADNFTESGDIDLTSYCYNTIYLGYKYVGGDPSLTTTIQIDDVLITGEESTNSLPSITSISNSPASPTEEENVTISATITDSDGTISSAKIKWGTETGSYPNKVDMTNSGDVYSGTISAQTGGTIVYYIIEATDNEAGLNHSGESNFSFINVNHLPVFTNISNDPVSPTEEESVTVSATITDSDGTITSAKLKWGTETGSYPNEVDMTNSENVYSGIISAQIGGTTVYYVIEATDNEAGSNRSDESNFTFSVVVNHLPELENISNDPLNPLETEDVTISAKITDSDGTITSTKIKWGNVLGNYPNTDTMTYSGVDDIYTGIILKQTGGTTVHFVIEAADDEPESSRSDENSFTFNTVGNEVPQITNISSDPLVPEANETVTVTATITDTDGTISTANVKWGTTTGVYPNIVSMTNTGDTYSGDIDSHPEGTIVYYIVSATDEDGGLTQSIESSYSVNTSPQIIDVTNDPLIPESDESVTVSATITDSDGTISVASLKWGTSAGTYSNTVSMINTGDIYSGVIPSQVDKTQVFFVVQAEDDNGASSQSTEMDYIVDNPNIIPEINNVNIDPANPLSSDNVRVSATITDADGTIATTKIKWGTSTGSYSGEVTMTGSAGSYIGEIPAQTDGTHVYFIIQAIDNEGGSIQSLESDYVVDNPNILPEISNVIYDPSDPESTEIVRVSATITDSDGTVSIAMIKWGISSGSYPNEVSMTGSVDSYIGEIPAQTGGTHVYFIINAIDNEDGSIQSSESDYVVSEPNVSPEITNITYDPSDPESTEIVRVSATITDADGTISSTKVKYGISSGSYTNEASMTGSPNTYIGEIPAHTDGTSIYFVVEATDNSSGVTTSTEYNYTIEDPVNIAPEITDVTLNPSEPTENEKVVVSCSATDSDGIIESVVLRWKKGTDAYIDVNMNLSVGKYYGQIPMQSAGETVNFVLIAEDNQGSQSSYNGSYEVSESIGIDDFEQNNIRVYPNPTSDKLTIELDPSDIIKSISVYNLTGGKVLEVSDLNDVRYTIELDFLSKGMYIVKVNDEDNSITKRIILR